MCMRISYSIAKQQERQTMNYKQLEKTLKTMGYEISKIITYEHSGVTVYQVVSDDGIITESAIEPVVSYGLHVTGFSIGEFGHLAGKAVMHCEDKIY